MPRCTERTAVTAGGAEFHRDALRRLYGDAAEVAVVGVDGRAILPDELIRLVQGEAKGLHSRPIRSDPVGAPRRGIGAPHGQLGGQIKARRAVASLLRVGTFLVALVAFAIANGVGTDSRGNPAALLAAIPIVGGVLLVAYLLVRNLPGRPAVGGRSSPGAWSPSADANSDGPGDYDSGASWGSGDNSCSSSDGGAGSSDSSSGSSRSSGSEG